MSKPSTEPVEVAAATWVEVGPGKFVRAEGPSAVGPVAGPDSLADPESVLATDDDATIEAVAPSSIPAAESADSASELEPEAPAGLGFIFRYHPGASLAPSFAPAPNSRTDAALVETIASDFAAPVSPAEEATLFPVAADPEAEFAHETDLDAPTADGTAPQVDGFEASDFAEETCVDDAATGLESVASDLHACWPPTEPGEPHGFADFDPADAPDARAVAPPAAANVVGNEIEANWGAETCPGPAATDDDQPPELSLVDADPAEIEVGGSRTATTGFDESIARAPLLDVPPGVEASGRSFRLVRAFRPTRAGLDHGRGRRVPRGRSGRSHGPARRPIDPRRLSGRRLGRPRQITRASPPRSPPSTRLFR